MPRVEWGWQIEPEELGNWVLWEDAELIALNKPAHVVCHPSKHGPWSSLAGACREYWKLDKVHLPSRLDRETSGVMVVAKTEAMGQRVQRAMAARQIRKVYTALLFGELREPVTVDQPIGRDPAAEVVARRGVEEGGQEARTRFVPLRWGDGMTLVRVEPETGRRHQIRVHAAWLGLPIIGDKLYATSERRFLEFLEHGWTAEMEVELRLSRQALHASEWEWAGYHFAAPLPEDWGPLLAELDR